MWMSCSSSCQAILRKSAGDWNEPSAKITVAMSCFLITSTVSVTLPRIGRPLGVVSPFWLVTAPTTL